MQERHGDNQNKFQQYTATSRNIGSRTTSQVMTGVVRRWVEGGIRPLALEPHWSFGC